MTNRTQKIYVPDVATEIDGIVAPNGPGLRRQGLRLSEHLSPLLDDVLALPAHADDRSGGEERAQTLFRAKESTVFSVPDAHC